MQTDLPVGWYVVPSSNQSFMVKWVHPEFGSEFCLARLRVNQQMVVALLQDFRKDVTKILSKPQGFAREAQLFRALEMPSILKPIWFLQLFRANAFIDKRGVDGFAQILVREDEESIKLPFQVKSSKPSREGYFKRYPTYVGVVHVIIVEDVDSDEVLRSRMYSMVGEIRSKMLRESITVKDMKKRITKCLRTAR